MDERADLVVVGAGIVGLAHAWHAARAGLRVVVVERDQLAVGASVRNFGHIGTTVQGGDARPLAEAANEDWRRIAHAADLPIRTDGTVVVARTAAEAAVLEEFAADRGDTVRPLTTAGLDTRLGFVPDGTTGAVHLPADLRVDAPTAMPAIAAHLETLSVRFLWRTNVLDAGGEVVHTTRCRVRADRVVLAVGHDVDRLLPEVADAHGLLRCRLRMLEVDGAAGREPGPALLTGTAILRYDGLAAMPSAAAVREETAPEIRDRVVNLMATARPDGRLVVGDTHHYGVTSTPFEDEASDELLLTEATRLFGRPLTVRRRWRGVYASAPTPFLVREAPSGPLVVSVTSGIGMTTAFGLARHVLEQRLDTSLVPG